MNDIKVPAFAYWLSAPFVRLKMLVEKKQGVLKPLELATISAVMEASDEETKEALRSQMTEINHAVRVTAHHTEVNMYKIVGIRPDYARSKYLPVPPGEHRFAKVRLTLLNMVEPVEAGVWTVDRRLFSIEFDRDVSLLLGSNVLNAACIQLRTVEKNGLE